MRLLLDLLGQTPEIKQVMRSLQKGKRAQILSGLSGSQKHCFLSSLKILCDTSFLVVAADALEAKKIYDDCSIFLEDVYLLPYLEREQASDIPGEFITAFCVVIDRLLQGKSMLIITPVDNLLHGFATLGQLKEEKIILEVGKQLDVRCLLERLVAAGYTRQEVTELNGQFSVRGGIIDLFPYHFTYPLRLEFFDDELDSIRLFDPLTQRSIEMMQELTFYLLGSMIFAPQGETLCHYFAAQGVAIFDEPDACFSGKEALKQQLAESGGQCLSMKFLTSNQDDIHFQSSTTGAFQQKLDVLAKQLQEWRKNNRVFLFAATKERALRLTEILQEEGIGVSTSAQGQIGEIAIVKGNLQEGFHDLGAKVVVVADQEIFGVRKKKIRHSYRQQFENGIRVSRLEDLQTGDYVVHLHHGIGHYLGLETIEDSEGLQKDYLAVAYANNAKLYIPIEQMDQLQKYVGVEGQKPKLSKIGGSEWNKLKNKVNASVEKLAEDLLTLYAIRETTKGYAFSADCTWQKQFEDAFPFEETEDQLKAIVAVKEDMEKIQPMDRLLCGDVGYGKTEVAMRAAFKAVNDGKQVAVLVPTTILAQQHLNTFRERFKEFPFTIEMISRFRSAKEQTKILKDVARGMVDIIIGTHRLVQKDIDFKDLGLIVVDEEQRFGVAHKEKLKSLKKNVDILTLSATPIPRTLYMSMVNIRSMSVIETPPEDRFPIQTYIVEYEEKMIQEAIRYELGRQGQVYFLHNRVESIDKTASALGRLVPEARIAVAHGQMGEEELEEAMWDFIRGHYDILVCTTIIETGLDVPNVNTLIIDQADYIGLASLYQLRGRVGRSNRVAYAYLTYRKNKLLSEVAQKRLRVMRDFTALGSGFKIAMRDLEIRGAGNILGAEQHGHMASIGFELYAKMLQKAIAKQKGQVGSEEEEFIPFIELKTSAFIPDTYVAEQKRKIEIYKKIASVFDLADIVEVEDELEDRFGTLPSQVNNLLAVARIKVLAKRAGVEEIRQDEKQIKIVLQQKARLKGEKVTFLLEHYRGKIMIMDRKNMQIHLKSSGLEEARFLKLVQSVLLDLRKEESENEKE